MRIVEGVESTWHYHLATDDKPHTSLCGRRTMHTSIPLSRWGVTPENYHIPEKWCSKCAEERRSREDYEAMLAEGHVKGRE